ncbi:hypothetical protein B7P43_G12374 [Cryptotermes secundus]|uniref:Uncharacterized protein n=3 Tax=Cryptotermes secundus TaxID=105785 RepID=A0A2J7QB20_9NEOP|nr:hypothetical protein B7P43_G12374 [Cryptotermes secundus]
MIQSQNQVMEKLKDECHSLTEKLEESSNRHKHERASLREENAMLMDKLEQLWKIQKQQQQHLLVASSEQALHEQMMTHMPETPLSHRFIPDPNSMTLSSTTLSNINSTNLNPAMTNINLGQANSSISLSSVNKNTNLNPTNSSISLSSANTSTNMNPTNSSISLSPVSQPPVNLSVPRSHFSHLSLSSWRHEVVEPLPPPPPPLTLEDLATDSDS